MNALLSRHLVHPLIFALRREPVGRCLRELERTQWLEPEELRRLQAAKLRRLLRRAWSLPFYQDLYRGAGLRPDRLEDPAELSRLPTIGSDDLPRLRAAVAGGRGRVVTRRSSGTTGRPTVVLADSGANAWSLAARHRAQGWHGVRIGDRQLRLWGRALGERTRRESLKDIALNRLRLDGSALRRSAAAEVVERVLRFAPRYLYGYPSLTSILAERLDAAGVRLPLAVAICTAETSLPFERRRLSSRLGCPVVEEYGCSEIDIVAFECDRGSRHVIGENVLVEVVDVGRHREGLGELVLTDLNNLAMPLVRYRIGDLGALAAGPCACGRGLPVLGELAGRLECNFVVTPQGDRIHTSPFSYLFERMVEEGLPVQRFRTVQESAGLVVHHVILATDDERARREIERRLRRESGRVLGGDLDIGVKFVTELPRSAGVKASHFESRVEDDGSGEARD